MPSLQDNNALILVTGANGFLGTWLVSYLLAEGFSVRAAVRNPSKGEHLLRKCAEYSSRLNLTFVPDMQMDGAYDEAVRGVDAIIHTASPVHLDAKEPKDIIDPAVKGAVGILESAMKHGHSVKRVIFTSSCAAILDASSTPISVSEKDWNNARVQQCEALGTDAEPLAKYAASKVLAEKAVWEFVEEHKSLKWDLVAINPPYMFGPVAHEVNTIESLNPSTKMWYEAVANWVYFGGSPLTSPGHGWVDVRDIATAHIRALAVPDAGGERIIVSAGSWVWQDWVNTVYALPASVCPAFPRASVPEEVRVRYITFDGSKQEKLLGLKLRSMEDSTIGILENYVALGML
ncbi:NAD(P)-binding protein [Aspergillus californicus]